VIGSGVGSRSILLTMKWSNRKAQSFSPGWFGTENRPESTPDPADAGCNSDNAQYSSTPKLHHSARQNSRTRTTTRTRTKRLTSGAGMLSSWPPLVQSITPSAIPKSGAAFRAHSAKTENPGLKPWAELFCPSGACHDRQPRKRARSTIPFISFPW